MNTANLQLEGLLLALAAVLDSLKRSGALDAPELETGLNAALRRAEAELAQRGELSAANRNAALFPLRFLLEAMRTPIGQITFRDVVATLGGDADPAA